LREKKDRLRLISEIVVLFEEIYYFVVVHVTGHDIPFDHVMRSEFRVRMKFFCDFH
jgi:ribosomal protein L10